MVPNERRYALLARLVWELRAVPVSSWLVMPHRKEPVLYVLTPDGRRDAVLAVQREARWRLLWRGQELDTENLHAAARRIALGEAA
jgi:hypothetical protein